MVWSSTNLSTLLTADRIEIMKESAIYHSDPEILGGTPVFMGTRVPICSLLDHLEAGDTIDDFLEGFPSVRREQVISLLEEFKGVFLHPA
jgi:uncharacterized protein (DUF433 family)